MIGDRIGGTAVADDTDVVRVWLEIEVDSDPIAGTIHLHDEKGVPFVGWLALSSGLERLRRMAESGEGQAVARTTKQPLTPTEHQIVALLCEGLTNPQIAQRLCVSSRTVQGHLLKVFRKLGVSSRTELVARVLRGELGANSERADPQDAE